jgi:O-antigen/teichoic acid export membrane protein
MKGTLFQAACVAIPKGLGGLLTIVLNGLLLVRMTPTEFGIYAICMTLVTLADAVVGSAIDMSAVKLASTYRLRDTRRAVAIEQWAVAMKLGLTILVLAVFLPLAPTVSDVLFHRPDPVLLILVLVIAAGVLQMRSITTHLQLRGRFVHYAGLELLAQALRVLGIGAVLIWFEPSAVTLNWAALMGTALALLGGLKIAGLRWQRPDLKWAQGKEFLHSLRWIFATFAFSSLLGRVDVLLLTQWSTMDQVGLFAAAQVFAMIPELLGMWLAVVFSPRVAPARENGSLRHMMKRVQLGLGALATVIALGGWLALQWGVHWLPKGYAGSADVLMPLVLGALAGMLALPITMPFIMFTKPSFIFVYDLVTLPFLLLAYHFAIANSGAVGAAWVSAGSRLLKAATLQTLAWWWSRPAVFLPRTTP